jgi:DNA-binding MarR family transcriptional regulator
MVEEGMRRMIDVHHEDPVLQAFMLFIQTARKVAKYCDSRFFQALHLSTVKYIALKALVINGGTLTHSDLAVWTDTERHNITTLVGRMKTEGLVTTERSEDDKRFSKIRLTDKGRHLFVQANPVALGLINDVMSGIGKREAAQLERLLSVLKENTERASEKEQSKPSPPSE